MKRDRKKLGMNQEISRRDFLNGSSIAIGGTLFSASFPQTLWGAQSPSGRQDLPGYYPPLLDGMRGNHPGSFEAAHAIRDGASFDGGFETGQAYDLVVVGGGLSGLAAAHFFRKEAGPDARILIIENHDDFGGHAKRNEFEYKGRTLVDLGGTEYIEAPWSYPTAARTLLEDIGIDVSEAIDVFDHDLYPSLGMQCGVFFDRATFGEDKLVAGDPSIPLSEQQDAYVTIPAELENQIGDRDSLDTFLKRTPLSSKAQQEVLSLFCDGIDYLDGHSREQKLEITKSISYQEFLRKYVDVSTEVLDFFWMWHGGYMGSGTDLSPAFSAFRFGLPGGAAMGLSEDLARNDGREQHSYKEDFHFPDGNASVARMLVRHMIPAVAPGHSMHDIVSARFNYSELDRPESPVRIRLNATVVRARHLGDPETADEVEVTYLESGEVKSVRAEHCIMACYHSVIPYLCPELPAGQKAALAKTIRTPLVSTNVLIDNWQSFVKAGVFAAYCPGSYFCDVRLTYPLTFADYEAPRAPDDPMTVHMYRIPIDGTGTGLQQFRAGRHDLLATPFDFFEKRIREQLGAMLGDYGFDPARDIKGITVNRWPHGYTVGYDYEHDAIQWFSDPWPDDRKLWLTGRQRFGRIAMANSDAGARAMTEGAIEEGYRATQEILN